MHLITGFAGTDHVTSANDGVRNAQIFGNGRCVVGIGERLRAQIINNNTVRIYDGYAVMDGRFFELTKDSYEDVTIDNGSQNNNRIDLICAKYEKNEATGIETIRFVVLKGTASTGTAKEPTVPSGNILSGAVEAYFPLYKVTITGLNLTAVDSKFTIREMGILDEMTDLQRQISDEVKARAKAVSDEATTRANANTYGSTSEIAVGTYNGKALYRKSFTYNATKAPLVSQTIASISSGKIERFEVFFKESLTSQTRILPYVVRNEAVYPPQLAVGADVYLSNDKTLKTDTADVMGTFFGFIEYTK